MYTIALSFYSVVAALSVREGTLATFGQNVLAVALPAAAVLGAALIATRFLYPSNRRTQNTGMLAEKSDTDAVSTEATLSDSGVYTKEEKKEEKLAASVRKIQHQLIGQKQIGRRIREPSDSSNKVERPRAGGKKGRRSASHSPRTSKHASKETY
jgi:hypothetical protein